jgi:phage-related protein
MPSISPRCHELRVRDAEANWRLVYRIDATAIVVVAIFPKKTQATPKAMIDLCKRRVDAHDNL